MQRRILTRIPNQNHELAGVDGPLVAGLAPVTEGAGIQAEGHVLGFAGSQTDFFKARSGRVTVADGSET